MPPALPPELEPDVLPLVPPYLIYLTGATIEHVANHETTAASKRAVMIAALMFVLGFSTVFVALGASASLVGGLIRTWSAELAIVAGIVIIVMGLHFLGLTRIGVLMREGLAEASVLTRAPKGVVTAKACGPARDGDRGAEASAWPGATQPRPAPSWRASSRRHRG